MKVRELVYWVVILLQLILLVGVKEHSNHCSQCQQSGFVDEMVFLEAYGLMHKKCAKQIPPFLEY